MSSTKNKSILNKLFESKNTHTEKAVEVDKNEFIKAIKSRRSVRIYNDEPVLEQDMKECLELALLAPNSSNLQPWEFYWVKDEHKKSKLIHKIALPAKNITNCTFGGQNNSEIFITTATKGMSSSDLQKYIYSGFLFSVKTNVRGFLQKKFILNNEKKRSLL